MLSKLAGKFVHGDIRHLEMRKYYQQAYINVHGDIRHLEKILDSINNGRSVHGDIRHLENHHQWYQ